MAETLTSVDVQQALEARNFSSVRSALAELLPADVAELIEGLEEEDRAVVFRLLPREQASETFECLELDSQEGLLKALGREHVATTAPHCSRSCRRPSPASFSHCFPRKNVRSLAGSSVIPRTASAA